MAHRHPAAILLLVALLAAIVLFSFPPIPQPLGYHDFADKRGAFGMPNIGDVASNAAFAVAGLLGMVMTGRKRRDFLYQGEINVWMIFFFSSFLIALGSGYYHFTPNNTTLVWDRVPMTLAFMSLFAAMIMERINPKMGIMLLPVLLLTGIGSVAYWHYTEQLGHGDLRPYALVQFFPIVAIALMLFLYPPAYSHTRYVGYSAGWYVLAKLFEHFDAQLFLLSGHAVSGHTLKHLAAAIGVGCMASYIGKRQRANGRREGKKISL